MVERLFLKDVKKNKFTYFSTLRRRHRNCTTAGKDSNISSKLHEEFDRRF